MLLLLLPADGTEPCVIRIIVMVRAFFLALDDLGNRRVLAILGRSLLVTLLIFVALGVVLDFALRGFDPCALWSDEGGCPLGAAGSGFGAVLLTASGLWLLFPAVAIGVISAYMDRIVAIVEARRYPEALASARSLGVARGAWLGLRSSGRVLLYNLIALPFYLLLLVTGIGTVILFVAVNGVAFGRDFGEMVAVRHLDRASTTTWLRATRADRALLGMIVTGLFLLPIVNLVAPVLGAAMATHLFHVDRRRITTS
ncbi:EI24 domain-containing protein [Sphingomonas abietis]|uniref:EI24 domain-containing protein n=1 Tax=Sphingomonas abietis TaxID=3012344 RepID=A0ABY7NL34_9SPHN|nr:EI24 domain-containing protein [Sphingomonas abietis]WBO22239.1 EI24 domain-containing protein [Sphingomonas abietis]